jgi:four helix bundle protein
VDYQLIRAGEVTIINHPSYKQVTITKPQTISKFDLEARTLHFSIAVIQLCKQLPQETINYKLVDQLVRSATSIGANYREANDALSKKDFIHRLRITRKEAKETLYWLKLIWEANPKQQKNISPLLDEADELRNILSAIINKVIQQNA